MSREFWSPVSGIRFTDRMPWTVQITSEGHVRRMAHPKAIALCQAHQTKGVKQGLDNHIEDIACGGEASCAPTSFLGPILAQEASPATWLLASVVRFTLLWEVISVTS